MWGEKFVLSSTWRNILQVATVWIVTSSCATLRTCVCVCVLSIGRAEQHKLFVATAVGADITTARLATWDMHSALSLSHTHSSSSYIQSAIAIHRHETESASTGSE